MGWTIANNTTLAEIIKERIEPWSYTINEEVDGDTQKAYPKGTVISGKTLRHAFRFGVLWTVRENTKTFPDGRVESVKYIGCDLVKKYGHDAGYKDMCESMGPCYYNCPLSFLDEVPEENAEWRKEVRKYWETAALKRKAAAALVVGQVLKLQGCSIPEITVVSVKPLRGEYGGRTYRIPKKFIPVAA